MSSYPMISVDDGILQVLQNCNVLPIENVPLMDCCNRIAGHEIKAIDPFPAFPASIMDGYAVCGPLKEGIYPLQGRIFAGNEGMDHLLPGNVAYITTGAMVPPGANAVVKVEDTEIINNNGIKFVSIKVDVKEGLWIRQIGSDIQSGDITINKGQIITPVDVGLLATVGVTIIPCYTNPIIGVLSTIELLKKDQAFKSTVACAKSLHDFLKLFL
jgi:gephyrin